MNIYKLNEVLADQPAFRVKQAWQAIFVDLISDWNENTTFPLALREKLNKECPLDIRAEVFTSKGSDTAKALMILEDGKKVETVLMQHRDGRATVCVSCQVGCALGCTFCATGKMGLIRNLKADEIVGQVLFWQRYLDKNTKEHLRITNVVYMGMGEPFLNYDNVMDSIRTINDSNGLNIGARHISISTCGIIDGIKKLTKEKLQVNLAISLHAPTDKLRSELMPINNRYHLEDLLDVVDDYIEKRSRRVMFEYLMIEGINDKEYHARELIKIMDKPLYVVNLIKYNATGVYKASSKATIDKFKNILMKEGINVTQRYTFGGDIKAACGQLATKKKNS